MNLSHFIVIILVVQCLVFVTIVILLISHFRQQKHISSHLLRQDYFRFMMEFSVDGVVLTDEGGNIVEWNPGMERITGLHRGGVLGQPLWDVQSRLSPDGDSPASSMEQLRQTVLEFVRAGQLVGENQPLEYKIKRPDGTARLLQEMAFPIKTRTGFMMGSIVRDITGKDSLEKVLSQIALLDELTGLYNRRGFILLADQQLKLAKRKKYPLLIFFADMDNMKWINDHLGHETGDQALIETASVLRTTFRDSDIIARLGGDEFAVVAAGSGSADSQALRQRFEEQLRLVNSSSSRKYQLSVSVGIVVSDTSPDYSIQSLIQQADELMYQDKLQRKKARS